MPSNIPTLQTWSEAYGWSTEAGWREDTNVEPPRPLNVVHSIEMANPRWVHGLHCRCIAVQGLNIPGLFVRPEECSCAKTQKEHERLEREKTADDLPTKEAMLQRDRLGVLRHYRNNIKRKRVEIHLDGVNRSKKVPKDKMPARFKRKPKAKQWVRPSPAGLAPGDSAPRTQGPIEQAPRRRGRPQKIPQTESSSMATAQPPRELGEGQGRSTRTRQTS
jgi:hypothetical protein